MTALMTVCCLLAANPFDEVFTNANGAYRAGLYEDAARGYEQLVASSVADPVVFFNLGNAYYRSGRLAEAIANYERALQLDPDMQPARENLAQALRNVKRGLVPPMPPAWQEALLFWHHGLGYVTVRTLAWVAWLGVWGVLALRVWRPLPYLRAAAALLLCASALFSLSAWVKAHPPRIAVAAAQTVPVRFGTSPEETVRFELYEGDRVGVEERRAIAAGPAAGTRWARIVTADGERGWVDESDLVFVGPPYEAPAAKGETP